MLPPLHEAHGAVCSVEPHSPHLHRDLPGAGLLLRHQPPLRKCLSPQLSFESLADVVSSVLSLLVLLILLLLPFLLLRILSVSPQKLAEKDYKDKFG